MKRLGIFIVTYKNRYAELINYTNELIKKYDVFIVLQNNDDKLASYDEYELDERIKKLYCDATTIGEKRQFILDYAYTNGYRYILQLDDDLKPYAFEINDESKRKTSDTYKKVRISMEKCIDECFKVMKENEAAFVSPPTTNYIAFSKPGRLNINCRINAGQFVMLDLSQLNEIDFHYQTQLDKSEDVQLVLELMLNNKLCISLGYMGFALISSSNKNTIVFSGAGDEIRSKMHIDLYVKYRDLIKLYLKEKYYDYICILIDFKYLSEHHDIKVIKEPYYEELYRLCKTYDIEAIKKHIRNKNEYIKNHRKNK